MKTCSAQVRRTSVLRSKTLAQAEFISAEQLKSEGAPRKARALCGDFITCCEEDRLHTMLSGKVLRIREGSVI